MIGTAAKFKNSVAIRDNFGNINAIQRRSRHHSHCAIWLFCKHHLFLGPVPRYRHGANIFTGQVMTFKPKSEFLKIMLERGFVADCTDYQGLDEALSKGVVPAYIGFDATAKSLHVGSLIQIMMLRWLQKTGHQPLVLMGGGTSKVGDPSFRAEERSMLSDEQIAQNINGIQQVFEKYVTFGEGA